MQVYTDSAAPPGPPARAAPLLNYTHYNKPLYQQSQQHLAIKLKGG